MQLPTHAIALPPLTFDHGWMITFHWFFIMQLFILALNTVFFFCLWKWPHVLLAWFTWYHNLTQTSSWWRVWGETLKNADIHNGTEAGWWVRPQTIYHQRFAIGWGTKNTEYICPTVIFKDIASFQMQCKWKTRQMNLGNDKIQLWYRQISDKGGQLYNRQF